MRLSTCVYCGGLMPLSSSSCPHCDAHVARSLLAPVARLTKGLVGIAASSAFGLTLMACYGAPPCDDNKDQDGDGHGDPTVCAFDDDCNDDDAAIFPGADDPADDGIDQNCDGVDGILDDGLDAGDLLDAGSADGGATDDAGAADAGATDAGAADAGA